MYQGRMQGHLHSSQVQLTPQDYISALIISMLNLLVVPRIRPMYSILQKLI